MTALVERTPTCPDCGWAMTALQAEQWWVCIWCGTAVDTRGRSGRWRDQDEPSTAGAQGGDPP